MPRLDSSINQPTAVVASYDVLKKSIKVNRPDLVKSFRRSKVRRALFAASYTMSILDNVDSEVPMLHLFEHKPDLLIELLKWRTAALTVQPSMVANKHALALVDVTGSGVPPKIVSHVFSWEELLSFGKPSYHQALIDTGVLLGLPLDVSEALAFRGLPPNSGKDYHYEPMLALAVFYLNPSLDVATRLRQLFEAYLFQLSTFTNTVNIYALFSKVNTDAYESLARSTGGVVEDAPLWLLAAAIGGGSREKVALGVAAGVNPVDVIILWMQGFYFGDAVEMVINDIDWELGSTVFVPREGQFYSLPS